MKKRGLLVILISLVFFVSSCNVIQESPKLKENIDEDERIYLEIKERVLASIEKPGKGLELEEEIKSKEDIVGNSVNPGTEMPRDDCIQLYQDDFDQFDQDVYFEYSYGCIELMEDINFDYTIVISVPPDGGNEDFYFTCNNHKLSGTGTQQGYGFYLLQFAELRNCTVENKYRGYYTEYSAHSEIIDSRAINNRIGFDLDGATWYNNPATTVTRGLAINNSHGFYAKGQTVIKDSEAINSISNEGFDLVDYSQVINSISKGNKDGFKLRDFSRAINCTATDNILTGFEISDDTIVINSTAEETQFQGFILYGNANAINSIARNNLYGFSTESFYPNSAMIFNSTAENNSYVGYFLKTGPAEANSKVFNSIATNSEIGYRLQDRSEVHNSLAQYNIDGFQLTHDSIVVNSISINNSRYGYVFGYVSPPIRSGSSQINNSKAEGNEIGVFFFIGETTSAHIKGGTFCNNNYDLYQYINPELSAGSVFLEGTIKAQNVNITNLFGNYIILPCVKPQEELPNIAIAGRL